MGKLFARIISAVLMLSMYKIWVIRCKGNILKFGVEWPKGKNVCFQQEIELRLLLELSKR